MFRFLSLRAAAVLAFSLLLGGAGLRSGLAQEEQTAPSPGVLPLAEKIEFGFHYSRWTLDTFKGMFESELNKRVGREIGEEIQTLLLEDHAGLVRAGYEHTLAFDSRGSNFGFELRYYPKGKFGSFSFGLSLEKNDMTLLIMGPVKQRFTDGTYAQVEASGRIELNPVTTNMSFRWDMLPRLTVSPYIVLGLGIGVMNGTVTYNYYGDYLWSGAPESISDEDTQTLKEAEEDMETNLPNIFPLLQANLGLRIEVVKPLNVRLEVGFWDGIVYRAGISFRFY